MSEESRNRGMLTPGDIEYLRGESSKSEQAARTNRSRIRQRIINAIIDFAIVFEHLEQTDRTQIFLDKDRNMPHSTAHTEGNEGPPELVWDLIGLEGVESQIFLGGIRSMHAFTYVGLFESLMHMRFLETEDVHFTRVIENIVEESLQDAYGKYDLAVNADVNITIDEYEIDLDSVENRFRTEEPVTRSEVECLIQTRRIDFEEMVEYMRDESRHKDWEQDSTPSGE